MSFQGSTKWALAGLLAGTALFPLAAAAQERLVVFGPSSWDVLAPGAPEDVVESVNNHIDEGFMALHPEVTEIVHDSRGTISDGLARLQNAQLAGDQVDVILCAANPVNTSYARLGLISPVGDLVESMGDRFAPGAVDNFTVGGEVWGVPMSAVNVTTFFYNKELFDAAGLAEPTTYDEFKAAAATLTEQGIIPVVHQGKNAWMWPLYYMTSLAETTGNEQLAWVEGLLKGEAKFTDEESLRALQLTRAWIDDGILDPQSNELDEDAMKSVFYSGRAAAYFGGSWDIPGHEANAGFDYGVFLFPQYADVPGHPVAFGGAETGLCVSSSSPNPELAEAYVSYVTEDAQVAYLMEPIKPIATSHTGVAGVEGEISADLNGYLPAQKFLDWVWPRELTSTIQTEIQSMMGGSVTPEEAAANMQAKLDAMVADGYVFGQ